MSPGLGQQISSQTLTFAMSVIVFALSINFRWSILTLRNLCVKVKVTFCLFSVRVETNTTEANS